VHLLIPVRNTEATLGVAYHHTWRPIHLIPTVPKDAYSVTSGSSYDPILNGCDCRPQRGRARDAGNKATFGLEKIEDEHKDSPFRCV
jgi:hypothetical protein